MRANQTVVALGALVAASTVTFAGVRIAEACGCISPPAVSEGEYAVNQQAEQIIFEVEPGWVTAHVLIKYAGAPESFAWIIPVPEAPELAISPASAFGLLDQLTRPNVAVTVENVCPVSEWQCERHPEPFCGGGGCGMGGAGGDDDNASVLDAAGAFDAPSSGQPPVEVIDEQVVGDYQTVTFRASEAAAAAQWLRDNGFIVNDTTTLYMESYVEANMFFVAAKLVPGAGVSAIKPLRMRYRAPFPVIPLVLTAVAAEPHLTVTTYVYGETAFRPMSHPVVTIDEERIARDVAGRVNYPMVLARTIDEAGGDGFAVEYRGGPVVPQFNSTSNCCNGQWDLCGVGGNGTCECPRDDFDRTDCEQQGDLLESIALLDDLWQRHPALTRITTRISPEEMRFDPTFEPGVAGVVDGLGRLSALGTQVSLDGCRAQVMDRARLDELNAQQACAAVYCGPGQCVVTASGAGGCACDAGHVARQFTDLDGQKSVTCIPAEPPVDLEAGGIDLPDACAGVSCGMGACRDRNGVAVCECNGGAAAIADSSRRNPLCEPIDDLTQSPGAQDFSEDLRGLSVCAPPPPACDGGWYERVPSPRIGLDCGDADPTADQLIPPPRPTCDNGSTGDGGGMYGCGCRGTQPAGALALAWVTAFLLLRKRRRRA